MPHGGFHGNVVIGQSGTTPGPAGMGSPPPKTHKEKVKDFFSMTPKERADRFNKNQKKYKKVLKVEILQQINLDFQKIKIIVGMVQA